MSAQTLAGARAGIPYAIASALLGVSFGAVALRVIGAPAAIVMSTISFSGAAQLAALTVLQQGGGVVPAIVASIMLNLRYVPMGVALGPWITGGWATRALRAQAIVDPAWVLARRERGRFDYDFLLGVSVPQYAGWVGGTVVGVLAEPLIGNPDRLGLDAVFPAFFLALLISEIGKERSARIALLAAVVTLGTIPLLPSGVPLIAAALVPAVLLLAP